MDEFDFALVPSVPKEEILSLAQGEFVRARENVILLGASGTGKTTWPKPLDTPPSTPVLG